MNRTLPLHPKHSSFLLASLHLGVFIFALIILAACNTGPTPTSSFTPAASLVAPSPVPNATATDTPRFVGGSIVIAGIGQPSREVTNLPRFISDALYDSLLHVDPANGSLQPGLADAWQVSDDARTFVFHLRAGLRWQDGQPLTAHDVVFTIQTLSDPALRLTPAADFGSVAEVIAPDAQAVTVQLKDAYCAALTYLGTLKILPEHVLAKKKLDALTNEQFVGSGPLVLKSWNQDTITFAPNANYWNGAPPIADWTYKILASESDARAAVRAGQMDVVANLQAKPGDAAQVYTRAANQFYALALNQERDLFKDARVRQAFAAALDRTKLVRDLFGDDAQRLETSTLKNFWAGAPSMAQPPYDPARARQLLAEAGWRDADNDGILDKDGQPLRVMLYVIAADPVAEPLAFAVREMLGQVGVQVLLQLDDRYGTLTRIFLHEYDLALGAWNIPLDPDQHWYWQSKENVKGQGFNFVSYANAQVDDLLLRGNRATRCDSEARRSLYAGVYGALAQDVPQVFLFAPPAYLAARPRVIGLAPSAFAGDFWNLYSWQVQP